MREEKKDKNEKKLYKKIAEIYYSDMPARLKNDCICRHIANEFNAVTVSMILYHGYHEGEKDVLVTEGSFLNGYGSHIQFDKKNKAFKSILRHIDFYEFIHHTLSGSTDKSKIHYEDFKNWKYGRKPVISEPRFKKLTDEVEENYDKYRTYKKIFAKEHYVVEKEEGISGVFNHSGNYYFDIVNSLNAGNEDYVLKNLKWWLAPDTKKQKKLLENYEQIGLTQIEHKYWLGLPLIANKRCFGIIRLLINENISGVEEQIKQTSLGQILSLFYGNQYALSKVKRLYGAKWTAKNGEIDYNEICEVCLDIINCFGCMLRLFDEKSNRIVIKGHTASVNKYYEDLISTYDHLADPSGGPNKILTAIFAGAIGEDINPIAASFNLTLNNEVTGIEYFYFSNDKDKVIRKTNNLSIINSKSNVNIATLFIPDTIGLLRGREITRVTIMALPNVPHSYLTFANTDNRIFTNNDIEFIYPVAERIALEITTSYTKNASAQLQAFKKSAKHVSHDKMKVLGVLEEAIENLNRKFNGDEDLDLLKPNFDYLKACLYQLETMGLGEEDTKQEYPYEISSYIETEILPMFKHFTYKYDIQFIPEIPVNFTITLDKRKLSFILFNLLNNAVNFSIARDLQYINEYPGFTFNPDDRNSAGHVRISARSSGGIAIIEIVNWGKAIKPEDYDRIFDFEVRLHKEVEGSGVGLYFVRDFAKHLRGHVEVEHIPGEWKTTFTLSIPLNQQI
jgi:hypothetical protein